MQRMVWNLCANSSSPFFFLFSPDFWTQSKHLCLTKLLHRWFFNLRTLSELESLAEMILFEVWLAKIASSQSQLQKWHSRPHGHHSLSAWWPCGRGRYFCNCDYKGTIFANHTSNGAISTKNSTSVTRFSWQAAHMRAASVVLAYYSRIGFWVLSHNVRLVFFRKKMLRISSIVVLPCQIANGHIFLSNEILNATY